MAFRRSKTTRVQPGQERAALVQTLAESGAAIASACGTCGGVVGADEPGAQQSWTEVGRYPRLTRERAWRYHRQCLNQRPAVVLARLLDPDARPIVVRQEHHDVAQSVDPRYIAHRGTAPADRGREPWHHVSQAERRRLAEAVECRRAELAAAALPALHESGWPCQVCGTSREVPARWDVYRDLPVCGTCAPMVERSLVPGNRRLADAALDAALTVIPQGRDLGKFGLARDMPGYSRHFGEGSPEREPWAFVADLPEVAPTPEQRQEERLAALERLLGAAS